MESIMASILKDWGAFPRIGLIVEGKKKFYPLHEAVPLYDSGLVKVVDSGELLESDFSVRLKTEEEDREFERLCDEYSARK